MKVTLYQCGGEKSRSGVPLGIGYLMSNCGGKDVELRHARTPKEALEGDLVGLSANAQGLAEAVGILRRSKKPVVVGGQGTLWPGLSSYPFRHIVRGEGERALQKILDGDVQEQVVHEPNVPNLDDIRPPVRGRCAPVAPVMSSRGCQFRCGYCSSHAFWTRVRYHSAERVVDEVRDIARTQPGAKVLYFLDDLMTANRKRLHEIARLWSKHGLRSRFKVWTFVRADTFCDETALMLRDMRTDRVRFGAESGSDHVLKLLGKTATVEDNARCLAIGRRYGLNMTAAFMHGIPGETEADRKATLNFIKKNKVKLEGWYKFTPFPGCGMYDGTNPITGRMRFRPKPGRKDFKE